MTFDALRDVFGCERLTGALIDRLTHRVYIIEANGPSYRLMQSKKRLKGMKKVGQDRDQDRGNQAEDDRRVVSE